MSGFLFHVTLAPRMESIAEHGLIPNQESAIGGVPDSHKRGRVFLCEREGLTFWTNKSEEWVEHSYDDYAEEGLAPVVLRVDRAAIDPTLLDVDELGSKDSRAAAFALRGSIPPEAVEAWDGHSWKSVDAVTIDAQRSFDEDGYFLSDSALTRIPEDVVIPLPVYHEETEPAAALARSW